LRAALTALAGIVLTLPVAAADEAALSDALEIAVVRNAFGDDTYRAFLAHPVWIAAAPGCDEGSRTAQAGEAIMLANGSHEGGVLYFGAVDLDAFHAWARRAEAYVCAASLSGEAVAAMLTGDSWLVVERAGGGDPVLFSPADLAAMRALAGIGDAD
jgi:hypothetical protein